MEFALGRLQIDVGFEATKQRHRHSRMIGINLAVMHIEDHWPAFSHHLACHSSNDPIRKKPKIATAEETHRTSPHLDDLNRKLDQCSADGFDNIGCAASALE